ncbi:hypothetical protein [Solibacillus palustris]|nr:hypothetical protein [Solibacillus sp. MA9]
MIGRRGQKDPSAIAMLEVVVSIGIREKTQSRKKTTWFLQQSFSS